MNQFSLPCHCSSSSLLVVFIIAIVVRLSSAWRCEYLRRLQFSMSMSPLWLFLSSWIFVTTWFLLRAVWGSDGSSAGGSHRCWRASSIAVIIVMGGFNFQFRCSVSFWFQFVAGWCVRVYEARRVEASARSEWKRKSEIRIGRYFKILSIDTRSSESDFIFDVQIAVHFILK